MLNQEIVSEDQEGVPNKIHYIWLGGQLPAEAKDYIGIVARANLDSEINIWYDSNALIGHALNKAIKEKFAPMIAEKRLEMRMRKDKNLVYENVDVRQKIINRIIKLQDAIFNPPEKFPNSTSEENLPDSTPEGQIKKLHEILKGYAKKNQIDNEIIEEKITELEQELKINKESWENLKKELKKAFGGNFNIKNVQDSIETDDILVLKKEGLEGAEESLDMTSFYEREIGQRRIFAGGSDLLRICILYKIGGIYLDTDVLPGINSELIAVLQEINGNQALTLPDNEFEPFKLGKKKQDAVAVQAALFDVYKETLLKFSHSTLNTEQAYKEANNKLLFFKKEPLDTWKTQLGAEKSVNDIFESFAVSRVSVPKNGCLIKSADENSVIISYKESKVVFDVAKRITMIYGILDLYQEDLQKLNMGKIKTQPNDPVAQSNKAIEAKKPTLTMKIAESLRELFCSPISRPDSELRSRNTSFDSEAEPRSRTISSSSEPRSRIMSSGSETDNETTDNKNMLRYTFPNTVDPGKEDRELTKAAKEMIFYRPEGLNIATKSTAYMTGPFPWAKFLGDGSLLQQLSPDATLKDTLEGLNSTWIGEEGVLQAPAKKILDNVIKQRLNQQPQPQPQLKQRRGR